jgi:hypothetical protein
MRMEEMLAQGQEGQMDGWEKNLAHVGEQS